MCTCQDRMCPKCDPGIEAFYQQKLKSAKEAVAVLKTQGVEMHYEDLLDAGDIWYEYCALKTEEAADDAAQPKDESECTY